MEGDGTVAADMQVGFQSGRRKPAAELLNNSIGDFNSADRPSLLAQKKSISPVAETDVKDAGSRRQFRKHKLRVLCHKGPDHEFRWIYFSKTSFCIEFLVILAYYFIVWHKSSLLWFWGAA